MKKSTVVIPLEQIEGLEKLLDMMLENIIIFQEKLVTKSGYRVEDSGVEAVINEKYPELNDIYGKLLDIGQRLDVIQNILISKGIID